MEEKPLAVVPFPIAMASAPVACESEPITTSAPTPGRVALPICSWSPVTTMPQPASAIVTASARAGSARAAQKFPFIFISIRLLCVARRMGQRTIYCLFMFTSLTSLLSPRKDNGLYLLNCRFSIEKYVFAAGVFAAEGVGGGPAEALAFRDGGAAAAGSRGIPAAETGRRPSDVSRENP